MPFTFADLINQSLVDLGTLKPGATPPTAIRDDCFVRLNQLWEGWSIDETVTNAQYHQILALSAGTSVYTFGTGGSLVATATPVRVYGAESVSGNFRSPVRVVSFKEFDAEVQDALGSSSVLAQLLAADNAYPSINLRVFPVPATSPGSLLLDYWGAMTPFAATSTTVALAPAFSDALHWNLAMALLPQYGRTGVDGAAIAANAAASLGKIQQLNRSINGVQPPAQAA